MVQCHVSVWEEEEEGEGERRRKPARSLLTSQAWQEDQGGGGCLSLLFGLAGCVVVIPFSVAQGGEALEAPYPPLMYPSGHCQWQREDAPPNATAWSGQKA